MPGSSVWHRGGVVRRFNVPRVRHHQFKVGVVLDACRDLSVILEPLLRGNLTITLLASDSGVVLLERFEELSQDLVLRALSRFDIWVEGRIVGTFDVIDIDDSVTGLI